MNYKKQIIAFLVVFIVCVFCFTIESKAKDKTIRIGNFRYTYTNYSSGEIWITQIDPLSRKGIKTLKIPSYIAGKKVVKLGAKNDEEYNEHNIFKFGFADGDEVWSPLETKKRVKRIKKIILPKTIKKITPHCFTYVQGGKTINIPSGIRKNGEQFCEMKWKKITISSHNKKYKIKNGILLSKDGKKAYGSVKSMKKIVIPDGVEVIKRNARFQNVILYGWGVKTRLIDETTDFYIPSTVKSIGMGALSFPRTVTFHVDGKNKYYAEADGSVYSKKTGMLEVASVNSESYRVPNGVKSVTGTTCFATSFTIKRIIIPFSVENTSMVWRREESIEYVFLNPQPPLIKDSFFTEVTFYVPEGSKSAYQKMVDGSRYLIYDKLNIEEMPLPNMLVM